MRWFGRKHVPWLVTLACTAYAVLRYVVFRGDSVEQLPVYVVNKGVSLSGLIFVAWSRCHGEPDRRRFLGRVGLCLIAVHIGLSPIILRPAYFSTFFHPTGLMTWQAELAMLTGVVAALVLGCLFVATQRHESDGHFPKRSRQPFLGRLVLVSTAAHVGFMGYPSWFKPETWPGHLPPITLLSFVVAAVALLWPWRSGRPIGPKIDPSAGTEP